MRRFRVRGARSRRRFRRDRRLPCPPCCSLRRRRQRRQRQRRRHDHRQLGHGATIARSGSRDRHDVGEHPAQHHGSARPARATTSSLFLTLAESWDVSDGRQDRHVQAPLRRAWTNGDPVTANDFEYSWKRTLSPELAADYAYQFFGIVGAEEYNSCKSNCDALRDKVGVKALDAQTLEVKLTSPQPWFVQQFAHHSFLAVNQKAVEQFGDQVDRGGQHRHQRPVQARELGARLADRPRQVAPSGAMPTSVSPRRASTGRMISDGTTAVQSFEAGEVDVNGPDPAERDRRGSRTRRSTSSTKPSARTTTG